MIDRCEPIYTEDYHGYTIRILPDHDPMNPRDWDNLGIMVCWHRRYNLGDEQPRLDPQQWLECELALSEDQAERLYESATSHIGDRHRYPNLSKACRAYMDALLERFRRQAIVLPLYLYDHSGLAMNTTGFHCRWDSGQAGFIYAPLDQVRKEWGAARVTSKLRARAEECLKAEVAAYDDYLRGDVYGYEILKQGDHIDSCWGFLGDYEDYCLDEARSVVDGRLGSGRPS